MPRGTTTTEENNLESDTESQTQSEVEQNENTQTEEIPKNESARETAAREFERLSNPDGNENQEEQSSQQTDESAQHLEDNSKKKKASTTSDVVNDPDLQAPERFSESQKASFNKMPKGLRREANKLIKTTEAAFTQANQVISEYKEIDKVLEPATALWSERGISRAQGLSQMMSVQKKLTHEDIKVREQEFLRLAKRSKIDLKKLSGVSPDAATNGQGKTDSDLENHPVVKNLRQTVERLTSYVDGQKNHQDSERTQTIVSELEAVRQEIDPLTEDFRYPELQNQGYIQQTAKPLVSAIKRAVKEISYGDALKVAVYASRNRLRFPQVLALADEVGQGQKSLDSLFGIQTRLPAAANNGNNTPSRASIAPVSVRGKTITGSSGSNSFSPPPEALKDARSTAQWAFDELQRGGR